MSTRYTPEMDDLIREYHGAGRRTRDLTNLPVFCGTTEKGIWARARRLGLSRARIPGPKAMCKEEKDTILWMAETRSVAEIVNALKQKGYHRSYNTVAHFIRRSGRALRPDTYTQDAVSIGFKCCRKTIQRWIKKGLLKAHQPVMSGDQDRSRTPYRIRPIDIAEFIINHPFELEGRMVDIPWTIALVLEFHNRLRRERRVK